MSVLKKAIVACTEEIERHKGKLTVKEAPRTVRFIVFLYVIIDLSAVHLQNFMVGVVREFSEDKGKENARYT